MRKLAKYFVILNLVLIAIGTFRGNPLLYALKCLEWTIYGLGVVTLFLIVLGLSDIINVRVHVDAKKENKGKSKVEVR